MKNLIVGLTTGVVLGLICSACCSANAPLTIHHMSMVHTDKDLVYTTTVTTEEGTYRIFTFEGQNGGGGISAVKIKD